MRVKRVVVDTPENTPAETDLLEQQQEMPEPEDIALLAMMDGLMGKEGAIVRIYRQGKTHTDLTLIDECSPETFEPMMLAHPPYNGGTFRIHARSKSGLVANRTLKVEPGSDAIQPGVTTVTPINPPTDTVSILRDIMRENREAMQSMMTALKPTETDPMKTLAGIKTIAEMVAPRQKESGGIIETLAVMERVFSLRDKFSPPVLTRDDGSTDPIAGGIALLREFKGMIPTKETQGNTANPALTETVQPQSIDEEETQMMITLMKIKLRKANAIAAANGNAEEFAESLYEMLSEHQIIDLLSDPEWFKFICGLVPECAQHSAFYTTMYQAIQSWAIEDKLLPTLTAQTPTPIVAGNEVVSDHTGNIPAK